MAQPLLVGIASNRPDRLRTCLLNVFEGLRTDEAHAEVFVCDGSGHARQNQEFATHAAERYGIVVRVVDEKAFQAAQKPEFRFVFDGPFGGPRNAILQHAVQNGQDTVFIDDDVVPAEQLFTRFQKHLAAHKIVVGAYAGKRTAAVFLMDKIHHALAEFSQGRLSREEATKAAREAFCGLSDDWPPSVEGYSGGCMGVSRHSAAAYAFYPSRFRMEDGMYCILAKHYVGQEAFLPFLPEAPIGVHKPQAGSMQILVNYYLNALQGACIGKSVKYLLENGVKEPTDDQIRQACREGPQDLLEQFNAEKTVKRRQEQKQFDQAVAGLHDAQLQQEYERFVHVSRDDAILPDLEQYVRRFFDVQSAWTALTQKKG